MLGMVSGLLEFAAWAYESVIYFICIFVPVKGLTASASSVKEWTVFQLVSFFHDAQIVTATPVAIFAPCAVAPRPP